MFTRHDAATHPIWRHKEYVGQLQQLAALHFGLFREQSTAPERAKARTARKAAPKKLSRRPTGPYYNALLDHLHKALGDKYPTEVDDQPIERFVRFESLQMTDARQYDMLACFCLDCLSQLSNLDRHKGLSARLAEFSLVHAFGAFRAKESGAAELAETLLDIHNPASGSALPIEPSYYENASVFFTRTSKVTSDMARIMESAYFYCYRYSTTEGYVAKSVMQILPPKTNDPLCRFLNRLKLINNSTRDSHGFLWRSKPDWTYFVGISRQDDALKSIIMRSWGHTPPPVIEGLLLSYTRGPLVSRLAFVKIPEDEIDRSAELAQFDDRICTVDETDQTFTANAMWPMLQEAIKNDMEFRAPFKFYTPDEREASGYRELEQKEMMYFVGSELRGRLYYGNSADALRPFNPAAHELYPFNQAIVGMEKLKAK